MRQAWQHIEAVQTTELPMLVKHIGSVLDEATTEELGRVRMEHYFNVSKDLHERLRRRVCRGARSWWPIRMREGYGG